MLTLALQILGYWTATSILGGVLWSFHRRKHREAKAAFDRWRETHPGAPLEAMPEEIAVNYFLS